MNIVKHRVVFFWLGSIITVLAIGAMVFFGMPRSIEFTGGSLIEVSYTEARPDIASLKESLHAVEALGEVSLRESGENGVLLRTRTLTPAEHDAVLTVLSKEGTAPLTELRFNSIGPSLGNELATKALYALGAVIIAIVLYIAWAFRRVSKPVSSWVYGTSVVLILLHDVIVPAGFYAIWMHFTGAQVDSLFVVAILAILGYSVNDTIVIFDRVRENLSHLDHAKKDEPFEEVVGRSITETLGRSINTSVTVALALIALILVGSSATLNFALVLLVGVIVGTYSSILIGAPLLIPFAKLFKKEETS